MSELTMIRDPSSRTPRPSSQHRRKRLPRNREKAREAACQRVSRRRENKARRQAAKDYEEQIYQQFVAQGDTRPKTDRCVVPGQLPQTSLRAMICRHTGNTGDHERHEDIRHLHALRDFWVRSPDSWKPKGKSVETRYRSLLRHILCQYPIPGFLLQVFSAEFAEMKDADDWLRFVIGVTRGKSAFELAREFIGTPMTRKMVHRLLRLKGAHHSLRSAVRRVQVETWCPNDPRRMLALHQAIMGSAIGDGMTDARILLTPCRERFWSTVIQRFCQWPELDARQVAPLIDYISHRPSGWSIKGRTAGSLLRGMQRWHRELHRQELLRTRGYGPADLLPAAPFAEHTWLSARQNRWYRIEQVRTLADLEQEGRSLAHCVASHARSLVEEQRASIWSLRSQRIKPGHAGRGMSAEMPPFIHWEERLLTIEVMHPSRRVVQVRGFANRLPTKEETAWVRRWCRKNDLSW